MSYKHFLIFSSLFIMAEIAQAQPTISGFTPESGLFGASVTITGTNFSATPANNVVTFNGTTATVSTSTTTSITTTVPVGATNGAITVTVGAQVATSTTNFIVTSPTITGFTPANGKAGASVTLTGTNFSTTGSNNLVKFNGVSASVSSSTATSITTRVPAAATTGNISVTVNGQIATSATSFVVCPAITLAVTTTNKTAFSFAASGGQSPYTYSLDGTNFYPASQYNLSAGVYNVTAKDANGCTGTSDFKINGVIDCGVTQAAGGQGTSFTTHILGSGSGTVKIAYDMYSIPDQMDVFYDNVLVASTNSLVSNQNILSFEYTYNPLKPAFCVIRMYAPNSGTAWEYAAYCPAIPSPEVTKFSPGYGAVGTNVRIEGSNFSSGTVVKFGSIVASSPSINPLGTIVDVNVPAGATTAPITVSNNFGAFTTAGNFIVSPYCVSSATSSIATRIDKVVLNNLDNTSPAGACETYSDYSSVVGYLSAGATYDLKVTLGSCSGNYNKAVAAFIDWNGNSSFADPGDQVAVSTASSIATREETFSVTVPSTLSVTSTKMRVIVRETSTPSSITPCGTYAWGETEDYTISFITSGNASKSVTPSAIQAFETPVNYPSVVRSFYASAVNVGLNSFTVTAPTHFQVSTQIASGFSSSLTLSPTASGTINSTVYVRYSPTVAGTHTGNISVTSPAFATPSTVAVSGTSSVRAPQLATFGIFDDFYTSGIGIASSIQTFRIDGSYLTDDVTITAPSNFQLSLNTSYSTSLTLTPINGIIDDQIVKVRYQPSTSGPHSGNIAVSSSGLTTQQIPLAGTFGLSIASFSPTNGGPGTSVTISGANFSTNPTNNTIQFTNTTAFVTASTSTSITTTVPSNATTGKISVTVGGIKVTSTNDFTVNTPLPTISSFTPSSGVLGSTVTIFGTNFSTTPANNSVSFNGTPATVTASTPTSITTTVPTGASSGTITVAVGGQTATSSNSFVVTAPAPAGLSLTNFTPAFGVVGSVVTISGTGFSTNPVNNTVKFNGITATVTASTATNITTSVPTGAVTGKITVTVGGQTVTSATNYTVNALAFPEITSFSPESGKEGETVTITGTNFSAVPAENVIKFKSTTATVTASTTTSITTTVPAGAETGAISITIGGQTGISSTNFTVVPTYIAPTISNFAPTSGGIGSSVSITGGNFTNITDVSFGGTPATSFDVLSETSITAIVGAGSSGNVSVTNPGGTGSLAGFTFIPAPTITEFTPSSGQVGAIVTITGANFSDVLANNSVSFNGTAATITASTTTSISTSVPTGATTGKITVTIGGQTATSATDFTVTNPPAPTITSFTPAIGLVGASVIITGTNFSTTPANNVVKFNSTSATVTASTATSITTSVPTGATTGKITVTVGGQTGTSATDYTVTTVPGPVIASFTPASGPIGTSVTISGSNFSTTPANNTVKFNETAATVTASTATSITTSVPSAATSGKITVTVGGQTSTSASSFIIITVPAPSISNFTPTSGPAGTTVTIAGTNFSTTPANNTVKFNETAATITASTATSITTSVPAGASTGKVKVTVGGQTATSTSDFIVPTCTTPPKPVITGAGLESRRPLLTSSSESGNQWYKDGIAISGETGTTLTITEPGIYSVQVTASEGCVSEFSDDITVLVTGTKEFEKIDWLSVYPIPMTDRVTFESKIKGNKQLRLVDGAGKLIRQVEFNSQSVEIDVKTMLPGLYYYMLQSESGNAFGKLYKE